jgi:hypothetical protein
VAGFLTLETEETTMSTPITKSTTLLSRFEGIQFNGAEEHFNDISCNLAFLCEHVLNMPEEEGLAFALQLMKTKAEVGRLAEIMQPYIIHAKKGVV